MRHSRYHKFLRISLVVAAFVLIFDSGLLSPVTAKLSQNTMSYVANAVGVSLGVPENEYNKITAALTERERDLAAREAALNEREIGTRDFGIPTEGDVSTYILSTILFILTTLIMLNYAMDFVRARRAHYETKTT